MPCTKWAVNIDEICKMGAETVVLFQLSFWRSYDVVSFSDEKICTLFFSISNKILMGVSFFL